MPMYKSKTVVVEAMKFDDENKNSVLTWAHQIGNVRAYTDDNGSPVLGIDTPEGEMRCCIGDYVVKEPFPTPSRRLYPVKADVFASRYSILEGDALDSNAITKQQVSEACVEIMERLRRENQNILKHSWPVTETVADDEHIVVSSGSDESDNNEYRLRVVGILNGVLNMLGCPKVCLVISDDESEVESVRLLKHKD